MVCRIPYPNCQAGQCTKYHIQMSGKTVHKTPYLIVRQSDSVYNTKGKFQLGWCAGHHPLNVKQNSAQNTIPNSQAGWCAGHHPLIAKQDSAKHHIYMSGRTVHKTPYLFVVQDSVHNTIPKGQAVQCVKHHILFVTERTV